MMVIAWSTRPHIAISSFSYFLLWFKQWCSMWHKIGTLLLVPLQKILPFLLWHYTPCRVCSFCRNNCAIYFLYALYTFCYFLYIIQLVRNLLNLFQCIHEILFHLFHLGTIGIQLFDLGVPLSNLSILWRNQILQSLNFCGKSYLLIRIWTHYFIPFIIAEAISFEPQATIIKKLGKMTLHLIRFIDPKKT